jgi:hypothetical protein
MKAVPQARGTLHRYEQWNIDENSVVSFAGISFAPATSRTPADTTGVGSCTL